MNVLPTHIQAGEARFEKNMREMARLVAEIRNQEQQIADGGGARAIEAQHNKKRLTARERIALLIDPGSQLFRAGRLRRARTCTRSGAGRRRRASITGLGRVHGRLFMIIANDATVKAGAFFPMTAKKVIRAQNIAIENRIPTIYLVDSAGVFLPLAGRRLSRPGRLRAGLPQQRRDVAPWAFRRSRPSWACAWPAALTCR